MRDKILEMFEREGMKAVLYDKVLAGAALEQADEGAKLALRASATSSSGSGAGAPWTWPGPWPSWPPTGPGKRLFGSQQGSRPGDSDRSWFPRRQAREARVTFTAVFRTHDLRKKEGMNSVFMYPDLALLDPELTREPAAPADGRLRYGRAVPSPSSPTRR
jgi:alcohol dehydrogenase